MMMSSEMNLQAVPNEQISGRAIDAIRTDSLFIAALITLVLRRLFITDMTMIMFTLHV